ncbi:FUSC family protein [Flavobacterium salilacus subsp. salilacus]|uniref:FUSC family protein n=1 Tax=Flavobacterium TaxID=237 RepID=UPI00107523C0|nr:MULTISPECIES: FUSC family membrane protein [Flavobacterium]KAF2516869.1 FUSC family protein [Flavobacterium salilacus subsp. salilacus]MBE1615772.1 FUSC family protein [Flavobacterium sp. SaA2.13]
MIQKLKLFTDSTNFTKALIVTFAAVMPVIILSQFGLFQMGFAVAIGAVLIYPSDIPSNLPHRIRGLLTASLIVVSCTLVVNLLQDLPFLFYPIIVLLVFFLSMISVYGQRATMVSFSGLLALTLASGHLHQGWDILVHCGLVWAGGLIYTLTSLTFNYLNPYRYTELQMVECLKLTSKYMKQRGHLWDIDTDREKIIEKQLFLQVELNTIHESLREVLLRKGSNAGNSNRSRKMLLIFISLVEVLELALSTSFDHSKLHEKFSKHPKVISTYQNLAYNLAAALKNISKSLENKRPYVSSHQLLHDLEAFEKAIRNYENEQGEKTIAEDVYLLTNMLHYAEKQVEKIKVIERAFMINIGVKDMQGRDRDMEKFLSPEYYPLHTLKENLSLSSTIFRLSLRLTITIAIGFIIGALFPLQNVYWILLTIVVIMRPGYGLTKQRSYQRIAGTVIGCVIAFGLLAVIHQPVAIAILAIAFMLLGFAFTAINYRIGATFVTIFVVFVYSMLNPDISQVIQYRIVDTAIGAGLAFIANYFFWPSWEFIQLPVFIKKSIEANRNYLEEISLLYNKKGSVPTSYRVARKNAFIEVGNLTASYQRMTQEPKSKQKQQLQVYKLAVLNHTLLSSLASLGTYIQSHHTTKASDAFNVVVQAVARNLNYTIALLNMDEQAKEIQLAQKEELAARFTELKNIRIRELQESQLTDEETFKLKMQEAQLIIEQLVWLNNLSEKIVKATKQLELGK